MFIFATWLELALLVPLFLLFRFGKNAFKMRQTINALKKNGFDGPRPSVMSGNMKGTDLLGLIASAYKDFSHNKVFWFFFGAYPALAVCDPEMIRQVLVKDFNNFSNRIPRPSQNDVRSISMSITRLRDNHWKRVRSALSPTFTTGKLKKMSQRIEHTTKSVVESMVEKQESNEDIELKNLFSCLTMDLVASVGFGLDVNSIKNPSNSFMKNAEKVLSPTNLKWQTIILSFFPFAWRFVGKYFGTGIKEGVEFLDRFVDVAFKNRKEEKAKDQNDFLQIMVNAEKDDEDDSNIGADIPDSSSSTHGVMTLDEIKGQALVFILAGYDTVSTVLSYTLFLLAIHSDCCKRVQEEIDDKIGPNAKVNNENVQKLDYLEMCINEASRLFPVGPFLERQVKTDTVVNGIKFQGGLSMIIPMYEIHHDPKFWPEPEKFIPERFTEENKATRHPFVYLPFGQGPRNCVGMRLAQLEVSIILASILQRLTPVRSEKTVYPVSIATFNMRSKDGLWIKLEKR